MIFPLGEVVESACMLGCHTCGDSRLIRVWVLTEEIHEDGSPCVRTTIDPRDIEMSERFFRIHHSPHAMPARL